MDGKAKAITNRVSAYWSESDRASTLICNQHAAIVADLDTLADAITTTNDAIRRDLGIRIKELAEHIAGESVKVHRRINALERPHVTQKESESLLDAAHSQWADAITERDSLRRINADLRAKLAAVREAVG